MPPIRVTRLTVRKLAGIAVRVARGTSTTTSQCVSAQQRGGGGMPGRVNDR